MDGSTLKMSFVSDRMRAEYYLSKSDQHTMLYAFLQ